MKGSLNMKKIQYLTITAVACVLALSGCKRGGTTTSTTTGSSATTSTTSSSSSSTSITPVVEDKVVSVTVSPETATIQPGKSTTLKASVKVEGSASTEVLWKSSDDSVATVTTKGVVKGIKAGTVVITAVSVADTTKSGCAVITVEDTGFAPDYLDDGFEYRKDFPVSELREFIGESIAPEDYDIIEPLAAIGYGCYTLNYPGDDDYAPQYIIHMKGETTQSYYDALLRAGWTQLLTTEASNIVRIGEFVDPTKTYTISMQDDYDYDDDDNLYFTGESDMYFFRSSDVWGSSAQTTDTSWDLAKLQAASEYYVEASMLEMYTLLPFIALGEDYDFAPVTELFWFWELPVSNTLIISDYSLNDTFLTDYGQQLEDFGYTLIQSGVYGALIGDYAIVYVQYGWTSTGNTIQLQIVPNDLDEYPSTQVASFVSKQIKSFFTLPDFINSEYSTEASYTYEEILCYDYVEDEETYEVTITGIYKEALVNCSITSQSDVESYAATLDAQGFDVEIDDSLLDSWGEITIYATKGYIYAEIGYTADYDPDTYENYDYGSLSIKVIANEEGEEKPIEFMVDELDLAVGVTRTETAIAYLSGTVSYSSSNPSVASVDATTGEVSALAEGTTVITATLTTETETYTDSYTLNVKPAATGVSISGADSVEAGESAFYTAVPTPEGSAFVGGSVFSIVSGGEYASIDTKGCLTANEEIETEQSVTIQVEVDGFSATKVVTITPAAAEVTDTITLESTGVEAKTVYADFTGATDESDAVYAGQCAGQYGSIQIRSKNSNSGIYSSTSGGTIKSVTLNFNENDTSGKGVKIVASNEPFESTSDLFSATAVATLTDDGTGSVTYEFTEDYAYVGIISADGAHYFDSIVFVWGK